MIPPLAARSGSACVPFLLVLPCLMVGAQAQSAAPRPEPYALTNVRLAADAEATRTILLQDGRIEAILFSSESVPAHMHTIDCEGLLAVPAFIDAFTSAGCAPPALEATRDDPVSTSANVLIDMRAANRKGIRPAFRSADVFALEDEPAEAYRKSGFAALLSAPRGELLAGTSALATTRDAAPRDVLERPAVFQHAAFSASGSGYPGTLMAYHAQLRQFFLDVRRQVELEQRYAAGRPGPRPPFDADLEAGRALLDGQQLLVCEARTGRDVERWVKLADELGIRIAISGGREAYKVADLLVERDIPVYMTLDWGEEVKDPREEDKKKKEEEEKKKKGKGAGPEEPAGNGEGADGQEPAAKEPSAGEQEEGEQEEEQEEADEKTAAPEEAEDEISWKYEEPFAVRLEKRREWELLRDSAVRLHEAGVRVVFGSGNDSPGELLKRVRTVVENGMPKEAALAAMTSAPAGLFGVDRHFGWIEAGHGAQLALWTKHPLEEGAQLRWLFVDGFGHEFEVKDEPSGEGPDEGVDASGTWDLDDPDEAEDRPFVLTLKMAEDGTVTGSVEGESPFGSELRSEVSGRVSGRQIELDMVFTVRETQVDCHLSGKLEGDGMSGRTTIKFAGQEQESKFEAKRRPGANGEGR